MLKQILFLLIISLQLLAQSPLKINGADHQIIFWAYNHQFEQAEKLVEEKIAENPDVPKYYFFKVVTQSLKHLSDSDQFNFETRFDYRKKKNEELIVYLENVLEKVEDVELTPINKFYLANLHGYLGRMYGLAGSFTSAFGSAKIGKDYLEELIEEYPELYDAYLLLGTFEYYADRLGGLTEFFAAILGFSGDRTRGLEYLKIAQLKGEFTKPFAEFILGEMYYTQEDNPFDAYGYFDLLVKKYPLNKDFYDWEVRILLQLDRLEEAKHLIEKDNKNFVTGYSKSTFWFMNGEYERASSLLSELIEKKEFKWGGAYRHSKLMLAEAALLKGEPIENLKDELEEEQLVIYNELKNNTEAAKIIYEFASSVGRLGIGKVMEIPQIDNLQANSYLEAKYNFYKGVYYFKYRDGTNAVKSFARVAKAERYFNKESVEYLIHIYKSYKPTEQQLDELEDIIDDIDDEDLEFSFMDLRK